MKRNSIVLLSAASLLLSSAVIAEESTDLGSAITSGKAGINLRARYENVDQDGFPDSANALLARLRLSYKTGKWQGLSAYAEYDHIFHFVKDFNSGAGTSPNKVRYPVVADPSGSDLNEMYFEYEPAAEWSVRAGRQVIAFDNERFVGPVGWRQNEQSFDALKLTTQAIPNTELSYSYITYVRRIFGQTVAAGKNNVDTHLLHAKVSINDAWSVTPYYYRIDNKDIAAFSTATAGARLAGNVKAGASKFAIIAEYATQSDIANNPVNYDADYLRLDGTWSGASGLSLGLTYESLGGNTSPGMMFRTPLATLHAFQGWADMFLTTPAAGMNDFFATVKYKAGKWNLTGVYHDFSAETGDFDYGTEFDVSAGTKISKNYGILFKGAFFSSDSLSYVDTNKFWIMFTANY